MQVSLHYNLEFLGAATAYFRAATAYFCAATAYFCAATAYIAQPQLILCRPIFVSNPSEVKVGVELGL